MTSKTKTDAQIHEARTQEGWTLHGQYTTVESTAVLRELRRSVRAAWETLSDRSVAVYTKAIQE